MLKKILLSGIVGTIVYFLLGWLIHGVILSESSTGEESMVFIFLGCLFYSLIFSVLFTRWAQIKTFSTGAYAGLLLGILYGLSWYFFTNMDGTFELQSFVIEIVIGGVMSAIVAGCIAFVIGKLD